MDKRGFLAVVLSLTVFLIWQLYFAKPPVKKQPDVVQKEIAAEQKATKNQVLIVPEVKQAKEKAALPKQAPVPEKDITVKTPLYTAVFTNKGGTLKSMKLKNYRKTVAQDSGPIEMVHLLNGMPRPLSITFPESNIDIRQDSMFKADVSAVDLIKKPDDRRLIFSVLYPDLIKVEKIFIFHADKYTIDLEVKATNLAKYPINQTALLSWHQFVDPKVDIDSFTHEGPVSFISKNIDRHEVKKLESQKLLGPGVTWGGFENKYFISAIIPHNPSLSSLSLSKDIRNMVTVGLKSPQVFIPPNQSVILNYTLYIGPKDHDILKAENVGLENAIDFGDWMKWLALPLLICLKFLHNYVNNYGIAIIILTIIIKIIFWPLGNKSYKSMKEMQKLQPKLAELKEKYGDDKNKISQETLALYRQYKVNPLGGCLPMIIQIPVFFGLYKTLMYSIELRHAPFFLWIQDLSEKDPYYITPIIMGATMFIQQKMAPPMGDKIQQTVMLTMPLIFTFLFLSFPSGLVLYWLFQNVISIGQQHYINQRP